MSAGSELVARIVADMAAHGLEPDSKENELLSLAEGLADRLAELEAGIAVDGLSVVLNSGRVAMNPAVAESRQTRAALASVLVKVSMTDVPARDPAKQAAALARWRAHNAAKEAAMRNGA